MPPADRNCVTCGAMMEAKSTLNHRLRPVTYWRCPKCDGDPADDISMDDLLAGWKANPPPAHPWESRR